MFKNSDKLNAETQADSRAKALEGFVGAAPSLERKEAGSDSPSGAAGLPNRTPLLRSLTLSDSRYKTNIETLPDALERVASLRGVSYDWRSAEFRDQRFPEGRAAGVLAQDVERVLPEAVVTGPNGYKGVYYAQLIPLLIESVKELKAQNDELREMIADRKVARPIA